MFIREFSDADYKRFAQALELYFKEGLSLEPCFRIRNTVSALPSWLGGASGTDLQGRFNRLGMGLEQQNSNRFFFAGIQSQMRMLSKDYGAVAQLS